MARRRPSSPSEQAQQQQDEEDERLAEHMMQFLQDYVDEHVFLPQRQEELLDKLEGDPDYRCERDLLEQATMADSSDTTSRTHNDDDDPIVYGIETTHLELLADRFVLAGVGTMAGLQGGRRLWNHYYYHTTKKRSLWTIALDAAVSVAVGTYMSLEPAQQQQDEFVLRSSLANVPLVAGRSLVSDELCGPLMKEYHAQSHRHPGGVSHSTTTNNNYYYELPELVILRRFIENCQRRQAYEAQLRQEQGLDESEPVSIPPLGVPVEPDDEEEDEEVRRSEETTREDSPEHRSAQDLSSSNEDRDPHSAAAAKISRPSELPKDGTSNGSPTSQNDHSTSMYQLFRDSYWSAFGQAYKSIEDFELNWKLRAIERKRQKLVDQNTNSENDRNTNASRKLDEEEVTARLMHCHRVARRQALRPERLYPVESAALYGSPSSKLPMMGESLLAGVSYYILWKRGPQLASLLLSLATRRFRAAPPYTARTDYELFGRVHAVGVAWLWYLVPLLQQEEERLPTVPLVEGRSRVSDEMCPELIRIFREVDGKKICEKSHSEDLERIYAFVRNCERRNAYENKIRHDRGLKYDVPVPIPPPGVPVNYTVSKGDGSLDDSSETTQDWAETLVTDRDEGSRDQSGTRRR